VDRCTLRYAKMPNTKNIDISSTSNYAWLSQLGKPFNPPKGFKFIEDAREAINSISSIEYENFQTEMQANLSVFLHTNHINEFQDWNSNTVSIKKALEPQFDKIGSITSDLGLDDVVMHSIRWDILHFYQERMYAVHRIPVYFSNLLSIYESGHIVCGYEGSYEDFTVLVH